MTALSEALLAAQRQATAALAKSYLAGPGDDDAREALTEALDAIGCTEKVDQSYLLTALEYLRQLGAPGTSGAAAPRPSTLDEPASQPQLDLIARLADERGQVAPQGPFTKAQASQVITALQRGEKVPF